MDYAYITKYFIHLFCLLSLHWEILQCQPSRVVTKAIHSSSAIHPTKINQITTPRYYGHVSGNINKLVVKKKTTNKKKENKNKKKKQSTRKAPPRMKEFPLKHLMDIGITSNEANAFIQANQLRGKPLEVQYERTRESDMNAIEKQLLQERDEFKQFIKMSSQKFKKSMQQKYKSKKKSSWKNILGFL